MGNNDSSKSIAREFDARAKNYEVSSAWTSQASIVASGVSLLKSIDVKKVLDLGAGTGSFAAELEREIPEIRVTLIDANAAMLTKYSGSGSVQVGNIEEQNFVDSSYDAVILRQVLHYLVDPIGVLEQIYFELQPSSCLLVGQFVFLDKADAELFTAAGRILSPNRRNSFLLSKLITDVENIGFSLLKCDICTWDDSIEGWTARATHTLTDETRAKVKAMLLESSRLLQMRQEADQTFYRMMFANLLFQKPG